MSDALEQELETRVAELGYELVELERAGSGARPILRLRVDRADGSGEPGEGVSLDDCARVSRALESYLDELPDLSDRYVLEVSSPGVERPLVRARDFERFVGREIVLKGYAPLAERSKRLEGELLGLAADEGEEGEERVRLRLGDGSEIEVPRSEIARAHLVFRWNDGG